MSDWKDEEDRSRLARRSGVNLPIYLSPATYDGWRSVRLQLGGRNVGFVTATYAYELTHEERQDVAERVAALWNLGAVMGLTTSEIEALVEQKRKELE